VEKRCDLTIIFYQFLSELPVGLHTSEKMELQTALDQELLTAGSLNLKPLIAQLKKKENRVTTMLV
jgi:hypothetical protein